MFPRGSAERPAVDVAGRKAAITDRIGRKARAMGDYACPSPNPDLLYSCEDPFF